MERTMSQRLAAEFVGTFTLIFIGAGSIIASRFADAGLVTIAIAHGLAIATMVSALGHISGGHFNPAITIGAWVTQKISSRDATGYLAAQLAGAAAGAAILRGALPTSIWRIDKLGTPAVNTAISNGQGVLIEAVLTFFLVWVVFATAIDPEGAFGKIAGLAIGFVILMDVMMGGPFTGAAMNPARWFGPALLGGYWDDWWVWIIGPVAGGIVAAAAYDSLMIRARVGEAADREPEMPQGAGAYGE